jgi:hypothetical protein
MCLAEALQSLVDKNTQEEIGGGEQVEEEQGAGVIMRGNGGG